MVPCSQHDRNGIRGLNFHHVATDDLVPILLLLIGFMVELDTVVTKASGLETSSAELEGSIVEESLDPHGHVNVENLV